MSKITIIEGNSNDKDNMRAFMVKGEPGDSPTASVTKEGNTATITITDYNGTTTTTLTDGVDGVSPTASVSKTGKVSTLTVTDESGTTTTTINDGEDGEVNVIDTFNTQEDKHTNAPSINAVENFVKPTSFTITPGTGVTGFSNNSFYKVNNMCHANGLISLSNDLVTNNWNIVGTLPQGCMPPQDSAQWFPCVCLETSYANPVSGFIQFDYLGNISVWCKASSKKYVIFTADWLV